MKDANSDRHHNSVECRKFTERRTRYFRAQRQADALEVNFSIGGAEIERVKQFRYLGRILDENDDDNHALQRQLARARTKWGRIASVLRSQGVKPRAMGYFYKAIVQTILLYGLETWVLSDFQLKQLRSFHSRVARYLTGRHIRQNEDGTWFHPPTDGVLEEAGLRTIDEYIRRRRDTVRNFVRFRPIYEVCRQSTAISNRAVWWKLDSIVFTKISNCQKSATMRTFPKMGWRQQHTQTHSTSLQLLEHYNSSKLYFTLFLGIK